LQLCTLRPRSTQPLKDISFQNNYGIAKAMP
jgi:hypothetical protein